MVKKSQMSGNTDEPEGGFDALMQAMVCKDQIKWREKARKLVVFATDATSHYAGDGKLGGINKPNDEKCHLDINGLYTLSKELDYPSVSQINSKVKENSVNVIWAVKEKVLDTYKNLSHFVEGSYAGKLIEDSTNIVELVKNQYNAISSSIEMKDTASDNVKLRYFSKCLGGSPVETNKCDNLKVGKKVEFTVEVKVTSCPKNPSEWKQKFSIYPVSIWKSNMSKNFIYLNA